MAIRFIELGQKRNEMINILNWPDYNVSQVN